MKELQAFMAIHGIPIVAAILVMATLTILAMRGRILYLENIIQLNALFPLDPSVAVVFEDEWHVFIAYEEGEEVLRTHSYDKLSSYVVQSNTDYLHPS